MQQASQQWAQQILDDKFAPWVRELALTVEAREPLRMRLANVPALTRVGNIVCGQALMAAADTAMVLAIAEALGGFVDMATLAMNTQFLAPVTEEDAFVDALVTKLGKSVAFGEVRISGATSERLCAHATITYSLRR